VTCYVLEDQDSISSRSGELSIGCSVYIDSVSVAVSPEVYRPECASDPFVRPVQTQRIVLLCVSLRPDDLVLQYGTVRPWI
jgi:hypothetical protein